MREIKKKCEERKPFWETFKEKVAVLSGLCVLVCGDTAEHTLKDTGETQPPEHAGVNETPTAKASFHSLIKIKHNRLSCST